MITKWHRKRSRLTRFGTCPLCHTDTKLVADHCHSTGLTRAPLCHRCNMGLGLFNDNPAHLRAAAAYLESYAAAHAAYLTR